MDQPRRFRLKIHDIIILWATLMVALAALTSRWDLLVLGLAANVPICAWWTVSEYRYLEKHGEGTSGVIVGNIIIALAPWLHVAKLAFLLGLIAWCKVRGRPGWLPQKDRDKGGAE